MKPGRGLWALLGYLWSYRWWTLLGVLGLLVADVAQLSIPLLSQTVIDALGRSQLPLVPLWQILGLSLFTYLARCLWRYCLFGVARRCDIQIRHQIYRRAMDLGVDFHATSTTGHVMALATSDVTAVRMALAFALMSAFDAVAYTLMSVSALFALDAPLAALALAPFPVLALVMRYLLKWNYKWWDHVQQSMDELTEKSRESISGMKVLRTLVQAEGDVAEFRRKTAEQYRRFMKYVRIDALYTPGIVLLSGTSSAILLGVGGQHVVQGKMTVGQFAAFASYLGQLAWPMIAAGWTLSLVQRGAASMDRILTLLEQEPEPVQPQQSVQGTGHLEVRHLLFRYPTSAQPALDDLSLVLPAGGSLGVVGEVGSGKSTLTRLLLRLYQPPAGQIWLEERDLTEWNLTQLRSQFAWVEQESFLFSLSIAENLRLGRPDASDEELEAAAREAELHDEVMSFPGGYQTPLGERGVTLSGGQKQRLCLARALLKSAPVLVLDDTLSAVDAETERRILERLRQRRGRQSLLVISHRVSSVRELDEILVLEQGKIVERGNHDQLLAHNGLYRHLWQLQNSEGGEVSVG